MNIAQATYPSSKKTGHSHSGPRAESPKVLLIEDHQRLRESLTFSLQQNGCEVVSADSGLQGFLEFLRSTPDLIVLDVQLPDMNGLQMLGEIRQRNLEIPIVIMTTTVAPIYSTIPSVVVLRKPFLPSHFIAEVERSLAASARQRRTVRPRPRRSPLVH